MSSGRYSLPRSRAATLLSPGSPILGEATGLRSPQAQIGKGDQGVGGLMGAPTLHPLSALAFPPSSNVNAQGPLPPLSSLSPLPWVSPVCAPLLLRGPRPWHFSRLLPFPSLWTWESRCGFTPATWLLLEMLSSTFIDSPTALPHSTFQTGGLCSTVPQDMQRFP